jgi:hypothetical protein
MTETAAAPVPTAPAQEATSTDATTAPAPADEVDLKAQLDAAKAESRKWEDRAKANGSKARELDEQRRAAMTDAERAVAEAENRGRTAAITEFGQELARERFDSLAGRRNPDFDTARVFDFLDLSKLLGEDGRPDVKAITAAVERLVPAASNTPPSFDGGTRTAAPPTQSMNDFIRRAAGRT